jgi:hypothetical protein
MLFPGVFMDDLTHVAWRGRGDDDDIIVAFASIPGNDQRPIVRLIPSYLLSSPSSTAHSLSLAQPATRDTPRPLHCE